MWIDPTGLFIESALGNFGGITSLSNMINNIIAQLIVVDQTISIANAIDGGGGRGGSFGHVGRRVGSGFRSGTRFRTGGSGGSGSTRSGGGGNTGSGGGNTGSGGIGGAPPPATTPPPGTNLLRRTTVPINDGMRVTTNRALDMADNFLGPGYREVARGVFRSSDGLRQVRMTHHDLVIDPRGAHLNFEMGRTITVRGRETFIVNRGINGNIHVFIID